MTRFKQALLDELVAHAQRPAPTPHREPGGRRRVVWTTGLVGAGMAAAAVAALTVLPAPGPAPDQPTLDEPALNPAAYTVQRRPDGTVRLEFRELANPEAVTRDLRAAGVRAQVLRLAEPGSCATTPGGAPLRSGGEPLGFSIAQPHDYPDYGSSEVLRDFTDTAMTILPDRIPEDGVLLIVEVSIDMRHTASFSTSLVRNPAPTCLEARFHTPGVRAVTPSGTR
jgi:hypothetical protein